MSAPPIDPEELPREPPPARDAKKPKDSADKTKDDAKDGPQFHHVRRPLLVIGAPLATALLLTAASIFGVPGLLGALVVIALALLAWALFRWWTNRQRNAKGKGKSKGKSKNGGRGSRSGARSGGWRSGGGGRMAGLMGRLTGGRRGGGRFGFGRSAGRSGGGPGRGGGGGSPGGHPAGTGRGGRVGKWARSTGRAARSAGRAMATPFRGLTSKKGSPASQSGHSSGRSTSGRSSGPLGRAARGAGNLAKRAGGALARTKAGRAAGGLARKAGARAATAAKRTAGRVAGSRLGRAAGRVGRVARGGFGRVGKAISAAKRAVGAGGSPLGRNTPQGRSTAGGGTAQPKRGSMRSQGNSGRRLAGLLNGRFAGPFGRKSSGGTRGGLGGNRSTILGTRPGMKPTGTRPAGGPRQPWRKRPGSKPVPSWGRWTGGKRPSHLRSVQPGADTRRSPHDERRNRAVGGATVLPFRKPNKRGHTDMRNPYQPAIDGLAGHISTENALQVLDYVGGLPALIEAAANRLMRDGNQYVEDFPSDPRAGEVAMLLAQQMRRMHDPVEKFSAVFERVHRQELQRIREPRQGEEKWDVTNNRG